MLIVETIGRIRREHFVQGKTIREIARDLKLSRNTVRKVLSSAAHIADGVVSASVAKRPQLLENPDQRHPLARRRVRVPRQQLIEVFHPSTQLRPRLNLSPIGKRRLRRSHGSAFVPLTFAPGEAYQLDWSHSGNSRKFVAGLALRRFCLR